jgi:hypothetical protein
MPKISLKGSHNLAISTSELEALDIQNFEVSPWAYYAHEDETSISLVDNLEDADGVGVYARLTNGLAVHVKDFNIDAEIGLDEAEEAQEDAVQLAETLNAYLPGNEPVLDEHLEAMYEDRVSGMDFDWE